MLERRKNSREESEREARKSSLKLATRADSDAAKGDRVFMSKRARRRRHEGWEEVVFTHDGCTNEAVNNDGVFLFVPLSPFFSSSLPLAALYPFSLA